jgi:hypothetical protein
MTATAGLTLDCRWIRAEDGVQALVFPVAQFPDRPQNRPPLWSAVCHRVLASLLAADQRECELLIQFHTMYLGASRLMSPNAKAWMPSLGMGVWPYREGPRLTTMEDADNFDPDKGFPFLSHPLCRVTTESNKDSCWNTLAGYGVLAALISPMQTDPLVAGAYDRLFPQVTEPIFQVYKEYWPLFDSTIAGASRGQLADVLCGAHVYFRESMEDKSAFIVSMLPLDEALEPFEPMQLDASDPSVTRLSRPEPADAASLISDRKRKAEVDIAAETW